MGSYDGVSKMVWYIKGAYKTHAKHTLGLNWHPFEGAEQLLVFIAIFILRDRF